MNKSKLIIIYLIVSVIIGVVDIHTLLIYFTVLPIQYFFFKSALKSKNLPLLIISTNWLISLGIGSVTFYLNRANADSIGFRAIGNFDFSYSSFYDSYFYLFLLQACLLISVRLSQRNYSSFYIVDFMRGELSRFTSTRNSVYNFLLIVMVILFSIISAWMYSMHIGMIGLQQTELPYHLTGILYYSRRFVFTVVLLYLFLKCTNKTTSAVALVIYAFFVSVTGSSKSLNIMLLAPVAFLCFMNGFKRTGWFVTVCFILIYGFVSDARMLIFESEASLAIVEIFEGGYTAFFTDFNLGTFLLEFIDGFSERLFGMQSVVLTSQYRYLDFSHLIDFYTMKNIFDMIPDFVRTLFGIVLPDDKAYGVAIGYVGSYTLLTNHNVFYALFQSIIVSINIVLQNKYYQQIMNSNILRAYKYVAIGLVFYEIMIFNDGNYITILYVSTLLLHVIVKTQIKTIKA